MRRLLDRVLAAPQGRIVVLGSGDENNAPPGGIQFDDLSGRTWPDRGYSHSRLANGLFSLELSRRLAGTRATSNCVSPGHVRSNILRDVGSRYRSNARSAQQGAATPCWLATSPDAAGLSGGFYRDFAPPRRARISRTQPWRNGCGRCRKASCATTCLSSAGARADGLCSGVRHDRARPARGLDYG